MTLTKAQLADVLFEKIGLNKREANHVVETFFEKIRLALEAGESVKLSGFGTFKKDAFHDSAKLKVLTRAVK